MTSHRIAVIAGDGIGKATVFEGLRGLEARVVRQQTVVSRPGIDHVLKFAFELASSRARMNLTPATPPNAISITMPYSDRRVEAMPQQYPSVAADRFHADILTAQST